MNFDSLNQTERDAIRAWRATVAARADSSGTPTGAQFNALFNLLESMAKLQIDDAQMTADDREYSRSLVNGVPVAPAYRHEFLMGQDLGYMSAWRSIYDPLYEEFLAEIEDPEYEAEKVAKGLAEHTYFEADPDIVDASLAINYFRPLREGETRPRAPVGAYAPTNTIPNFSYTISGTAVTFVDESAVIGSPTTARLWTFGDGTTSTAASPVKTYAAIGTYNVTLRITNAKGNVETTQQVYIPPSAVNLRAYTYGSTSNNLSPVPVKGQSGVMKIACGDNHTLVLKQDFNGNVKGWGSTVWGQLDIPNDDNDAGTPVNHDVIDVAAGSDHSMALKPWGEVVCWGRNTYGQCDVPEDALSDCIKISGGLYHSMALKEDGTVLCWGNDMYGQVQVPDEAVGIVDIAAGGIFSVALKADGTLVVWTNYQELIDEAVGLTGVDKIVAGIYDVLCLKDGECISFGFNYYGEGNVPLAAKSGVTDIGMGAYHCMAIKNGGVIGWGQNNSGQAATNHVNASSGVLQVDGGTSHTVVMKAV